MAALPKRQETILAIAIKVDTKQMRQAENEVRKFQRDNLAMGLSFLFTGMAIKRMFDSIMKSSFKTYTRVMGETSEYAQGIGRLTGGFEFLKFSIAEAFAASTAGRWLLETIIKIVDWTSAWISKHQSLVVVALSLVGALSTTMMLYGQYKLFRLGWKVFMDKLLLSTIKWADRLKLIKGYWKSMFGTAGKIGTAIWGNLGLIAGVSALVAVLLVAAFILWRMQSQFDSFGKFWDWFIASAKGAFIELAKVMVTWFLKGLLEIAEFMRQIADAMGWGGAAGEASALKGAISQAMVSSAVKMSARQMEIMLPIIPPQPLVGPLEKEFWTFGDINIGGGGIEEMGEQILDAQAEVSSY